MEIEEDWQLTGAIEFARGRGDPFAAAIRGTSMPMVITDTKQPDHLMVFANKAFQQMTGYSRDELIGRDCRFLQGPDSDPAAIQAIRDGLDAQRPVDVDLLNYRKDGSAFWNAVHIAPVRDDGGTVRFYVASMLDITERIEAAQRMAEQKAAMAEEVRRRTADLEAALAAKTTLLHELDHRVKNNLTMIGALVRLQARAASDRHVRRTLEDMLERIDALAAVHRRLFQTEDITKFDLGSFVDGLAADVLAGSGRSDVALEAVIEPVQIRAADAASVALILNELITNAVKHGFAGGRGGVLKLDVRRVATEAIVTLADDGPGFDPAACHPATLGRPLVERLSRQIGARTEWNGGAAGTSVTVRFAVDG